MWGRRPTCFVTNFTATFVVDEVGGKDNGRVVFKVLGDDDKVLWQSPEMRAGDEPQKEDASIKGLKQIALSADDDVNNEHKLADWADAKITLHSKEYKDVRPNTIPAFKEEATSSRPVSTPCNCAPHKPRT